jgi:uncharacterized protein YcbX
MQGEAIEEGRLGPLGLEGDRRWAVVDPETGASLSAKRVGRLLLCRSFTDGEQVSISLPDGSEFPVDSSRAAQAISEYLDRPVELRRAEAGKPARHEYPEDRLTGTGPAVITEPRLDAFFDAAPVHIVSTATLGALAGQAPDSLMAPARFRPNLLVELMDHGPFEEGWVGRDLLLPEAALTVTGTTSRCVVTTRPQGNLPSDPGVLGVVRRFSQGRVGVYASVLVEGRIGRGARLVPVG